MNTRRIVIFVPFIQAFGGVERQVLDLSRFLHHEEAPHTILSFQCTVDLAEHAQWPVHVHVLDVARNPVAESQALARYFKDSGSGDIQTPLFFDLKAAFYAGLHRSRSFHLHLTDPPSLLPRDRSKYAPSIRKQFAGVGDKGFGPASALRGEVLHWINRRGVRRSNTLISTTHAIAAELRSLYGKEATVVNPGIHPPAASVSRRVGKEPPMRFLSVCRLETNKRIDWMLHALAEIEASDTPLSVPWRLDVVGDGREAAALRNLANGLGIADRVVFHGRISDGHLEALFAEASAFLMPALQGYGLPALEALIRRVPVVMHRQSGASEILDHRPWVEMVEDGPEDLARAIRAMAANIEAGALEAQAPPKVPTAEKWAQRVVDVCGWS